MFIKWFDHARIYGFANTARGYGLVALLNAEPFTKGCVGQVVSGDVLKAGVEVAGPHPFLFVHFDQWFMGEQNHARETRRNFKERCRKLVQLDLRDNLVDPATPFFANANSTHQRGKCFIAGSGR